MTHHAITLAKQNQYYVTRATFHAPPHILHYTAHYGPCTTPPIPLWALLSILGIIVRMFHQAVLVADRNSRGPVENMAHITK